MKSDDEFSNNNNYSVYSTDVESGSEHIEKYIDSGELFPLQPDRIFSDVKLEKMTTAIKTLLETIGENPNREGLIRTPERYAKALLFFTKGYGEDVETIVNGAVFDEPLNEPIILRDLDITSLCEHHLVPFIGKIHIAYVPNGKVIGLSKLARITEIFSKRLQIQERLTRQIANALDSIIQPKGVAVMIEAKHLCMVARGVQKPQSLTVTTSMTGIYKTDAKLREEFYSLAHLRKDGDNDP